MISIILKKELKVFFRSPMAYIIAGLFTLIIGWMFFQQLNYFVLNIQKLPLSMRNQYDFANEVIIKLLGNINFIFLFLVPILGMKVFSEEYKEHTMQIYDSSPISDFELILGKYLSLTIQCYLILGITLVYPILLSNLELSDAFFVITGYLGLMFNIACYCALTCFASAITANQIVASLIAFVFILASWMTSLVAQISSDYFTSKIFSYISVNDHFENFVKANISLSDLCFYFSFILFSLLLLKKRLEIRQWLK